MSKNVIRLACSRILIDDVEPTNTQLVEFKDNNPFQLEQCFCSCSIRPRYDYHLIGNHWTQVEEHYEDCPNADPARFMGYVEE